jgi:hypothetical protein
VFDPGSNDVQKKDVTVAVGEMLVVTKEMHTAPPVVVPIVQPPAQRPQLAHPFSPAWIAVAGTATIASALVPYFAYSHANDLFDRYSPPHAATATEQSDYSSARTLAYWSWAVPGLLAATTVTIAVVYFAKTKTILVPVVTDQQAGMSLGGVF